MGRYLHAGLGNDALSLRANTNELALELVAQPRWLVTSDASADVFATLDEIEQEFSSMVFTH